MSNVAAGKNTDDDGETLNDVEKTLNKMGIALRSAKGEWRSFEDVLDEVASKWKDFDETKQSQIATAIAGVRQQENFRALMSNYDEVSRLVGVAADSTGSATERMGTYLDSIEAKTNKLKSSWEGFILSLNQNESWGQVLDWLTQLLEKLKYVDWKMVAIVATVGSVITVILKLVPAIKTLIATIGEGGILAGIASGGIIPVLGLIATGILAIAAAWKSASNNAEGHLEEIKEQRKELENEESTVKDLYKRYSELEGKSKYYSLTSQEKQELSDITKTLVEQYGFESDGIDTLTGGYKLANNALEKYIENLEKEKRLLSKDEQKTLKKEAKDDIKDIKNSQGQINEIEKNYGKLVTGTDDEKKDIIRQFGALGVYQNKINQSVGRVGSKEDRQGLANAKEALKKYGFDDNDFNTNDPLGAYSLLKRVWDRTDASQSGLKLTDKDVNTVLNQLYKDVGSEYQKEKNNIGAKSKEVASDITKLLTSELGEDVPNSVANVISKSLSTALSQDGMVDSIKDVDKFINDYTQNFSNKISANGEEIEKVLNKYQELQDKANNGTLKAGEYEEYQNALHTYLEMQREALKATGLTDEQVNKLMESFENQAVDNLNVKLLELNKNLQNNSEISDDTKKKYSDFIGKLNELKGNFAAGKITAKDYFDSLNKQINSIDVSSLEKVNETFGDTKNYLSTMGAVWQDSQKYLDSIWTTFQGGGDSLEFFNNFDSAANSIVNLTKSLQEFDKANNDIDLTKITTSKEDVKKNVDAKLNINTDMSQIEKAMDYINKLDGQDLDVKIQADGLKDAEDGFDDILKAVEETSDGTLDLQKNTDDLVSSLKELEDLNLNNVDSAFETLKAGFSDLQNGATSLIGTASQEIQNSAKYMSQWIFDIANSDKEYAETAKQTILDITSNTGAAIQDISQTNVESLAQALMADEQNANTFAAGANSIASQSMQTAVKNLGKTLETMGNALATLNISIPIKLKGVESAITVNGVPIVPIGFEGIETDLTIGGEGTKGLSDIGKSLASFGKSLQDDKVSNIIANQFTPVQSNYTPNIGGKKDNGNKDSNYNPKGSGSKKKKSGSDYSADDAASDLKDILNDIEKYEAEIELDLEDQTEELLNHYNLKRNQLDTLKEELDYYDSIYDVTENTTKWLDTQLKILDNQSKKVAEIQNSNDKIDKQRQKIYNENSKYNVQSWFDSEGNETLAYGNLLNSFEYRKNQVEKETADAMRAEYNKVANSTDKDTIKAAKDKIKQIQEEGDTKIKLIDKERTYVENVYDSVGQLNDAWKDNQEAIRESLQELNDRVKSIRDELVDDIMEQLEKAVDKMNKSLDKDVTRLEQLKQVQQSYNDILNDTIDTQQELADELKSNMDSYEYLDDTMRQLMFNEDDYKALSGVLEGIQSDIANIWEDHYNQIQDLTEDEMYKAEYITNETERQLAAKQKEYELAKAELDVAKAQTNLNNVKNERNTRIFANGQWQWTANPDDVKSAQQQLMEAEREKTKLEREAEQQILIDSMDKMIDADNLQIDKNNDLLEKIQEKIEEQTVEVKSIEEALMNADKANLPALTNTLVGALGSDGGYMKQLLGEINHSQVELAAALRGQTIQQAVDQLKSGTMSQSDFEELTKRLGYSFNETTGMVTTQDGSFAAHYRGWTKKSNNDIQLGTAENGVQTTGGNAGAGQASAATSGGNGGGSTFPRNGRVSTSSLPLRIRSGAGTQYRILGTMPKGANVTILGEANSGWAQVKYGSITGYASRQYLSYDQGGIANGLGYMPKATLEPERVLSPRQTKSFENLVTNLTTNPVLNALSKVPKIASTLGGQTGETNNSKNYYFSNFTVQADDIKQFINSIETMMPMKK